MNKKNILILLLLIMLSIWGYNKFFNIPDYPNTFTPRPDYGSGEIVITEYSDLQCPFCLEAHPIIKSIIDEYEGKVRWEWKHFPLTGIHDNAFKAAEASECANDQGMFWEYVDESFVQQRDLSRGNLVNIAEQLGLDRKSFRSCLYSRAKKSIVSKDLAEATQKRLSGTPSVFLNGVPVRSWKYDALKADIERLISDNKE